MSVIGKAAAGGGYSAVGFWRNTPIYRAITDDASCTRLPILLPAECLRLIHKYMEYSNGSYPSSSGYYKPKFFAVPWFIEVPHPTDCIVTIGGAGRAAAVLEQGGFFLKTKQCGS